MRVLLLGMGRMGQRYVTTLSKMCGTELSLTTVDPKKSNDTPEIHYSSISDVPRDLEFDLAIDSRPNIARFETLKALVDMEIPKVLVEKPHAASLQESEKMLSLIEENPNTHVMIPFFRRFSPMFDAKKLSSLKAGKLISVDANAGAIGIGCNGVHLLDSVNYLFGSTPKSIMASIKLDSIFSPRGPEFKDYSGAMLIEYDQERKFILNILDQSSAGATTTFYFENGKIITSEQQKPFWKWFRRSDADMELPPHRTHMESEVEPAFDYKMDLFELIETGLEKFMSSPTSVPNLNHSHTVLKTIALAIESSQSGKRLNFDDAGNLESLKKMKFNFT